jgi:hypothetical protein
MMLFRPAGLIPERRHRLEIEEGVEHAAVAAADQSGDRGHG